MMLLLKQGGKDIPTNRAEKNGSALNSAGAGAGAGAGTHYIVWMYPFPPPNFEIDNWTVPQGQILICPYRNACNGKGRMVNLAELTKDTLYHSYILDHPYQKLRHMTDFCHHIQAIAMISLLLKNDGEL
jgi:hypothetical protein